MMGHIGIIIDPQVAQTSRHHPLQEPFRQVGAVIMVLLAVAACV